ncbi:helix-turn-helix domain-containing protein [Roseiconus lacunae]|uniref:Helix-turn-helix domain-containing protein n=1 Tax=Roseiconus lacunae TaxID=2605694 RepID=A0ABT7PHM0_9BACT|nr:helix-turn-helix domain-containing protein [Roseiconus lacunae]MDM4015990.1 helix-turn-helix domain-containing protein [Roseiconus lacunae]
MEGSSEQLQIDFDRFERDAMIEHADIPDGVANDGAPVKADKIKSLLLKLNSHLGKNGECWPSQELLACKMSVSTKTVRRAAEAAQNLSLLICQLKNRPGKRTVINHYRIVWSELLLLDKARARAFRESIAGIRSKPAADQSDNRPDQSDTVTDQSDNVTFQSDNVTDQSDKLSPEPLTNKSPNQKENQPLRRAARTRAHRRTLPAGYDVVVVALKGLGVRAWQSAIDAAVDRQLSPEQLLAFCDEYRRLLSRDSRTSPAYLYRWITGQSDPPSQSSPVTDTAAATIPRVSMTTDRTAMECERARIVQHGRRIGAAPDQIRQRIRDVLRARGFDPESIPADVMEV